MLFNVVNEKDPRIRITILRPSWIAAMTGSAAPPNNRQFRCNAEFVCPVPKIGIGGCLTAPPTGSPGLVTHPRLPQIVACRSG